MNSKNSNRCSGGGRRRLQEDMMDCGHRRPRSRRRFLDCSNSSSFLSEDIIAYEILVRLPVRSLLRFKCVSKSWYALISNPNFNRAQLERAQKIPKLLITSTFSGFRKGNISIYSYDLCGKQTRQTRFLFSKRIRVSLKQLQYPQYSNGLLLLNTVSDLILCNPSIRQYTYLPRGSDSARTWSRRDHPRFWGDDRTGFGFVRSINSYKVGQYFYRSYNAASGTWSMGFEVMTIGVDSRWRVIKEEVPYPVDGNSPFSVGESIYYYIDKSLNTTLPGEVDFFAFNLSDEKFTTVSLPSDLPPDYTSMDFSDLNGDTCFSAQSDGDRKLDVWVKKNYSSGGGGHAWTHIFSINLLRPIPGVAYPVTVWNESLLLCINAGTTFKLAYYSTESKSLEEGREVDLVKDLAYYNRQMGSRDSFVHVIPYSETLVPVPVISRS